MLEMGVTETLVVAKRFEGALDTLFLNQHRLESCIRDGAALINPICFYCGWCQACVKLDAVTGDEQLECILRHWTSPLHIFDEEVSQYYLISTI